MATLTTADGKTVGKYYAGPTWEANDGSKVVGAQVAVSPAGACNIPLQLVKAKSAMRDGATRYVSYIQRLNTKAGVAPTLPCGADQKGQKQQVGYQPAGRLRVLQVNDVRQTGQARHRGHENAWDQCP